MIDWTIKGRTCIISDLDFGKRCDAYVLHLKRHGKTLDGIYGYDGNLCVHSRNNRRVHIWYAERKINDTQVEEFINKVNSWYEKIYAPVV